MARIIEVVALLVAFLIVVVIVVGAWAVRTGNNVDTVSRLFGPQATATATPGAAARQQVIVAASDGTCPEPWTRYTVDDYPANGRAICVNLMLPYESGRSVFYVAPNQAAPPGGSAGCHDQNGRSYQQAYQSFPNGRMFTPATTDTRICVLATLATQP